MGVRISLPVTGVESDLPEYHRAADQGGHLLEGASLASEEGPGHRRGVMNGCGQSIEIDRTERKLHLLQGGEPIVQVRTRIAAADRFRQLESSSLISRKHHHPDKGLSRGFAIVSHGETRLARRQALQCIGQAEGAGSQDEAVVGGNYRLGEQKSRQLTFMLPVGLKAVVESRVARDDFLDVVATDVGDRLHPVLLQRMMDPVEHRARRFDAVQGCRLASRVVQSPSSTLGVQDDRAIAVPSPGRFGFLDVPRLHCFLGLNHVLQTQRP